MWKSPLKHLLLIVGTMLAAAPLAKAAVWETTQQWTDSAEQDYTQWVHDDWSTQILETPGAWYNGLKVDCAKAVYSMRIIYAADHGLPFAMQDPTGGTKPITNDMTRFDSTKDAGQRKRAFLSFIFSVGNTASLPNDTFPVPLSSEYIHSGALMRTDETSRHAWTIQQMDALGYPHLIYSSMPARSNLSLRLGFPTMGFMFPNGLNAASGAGFRYFRHPGDIGKPVWKVPGYSEQQYQIPFEQWQDTVQRMLATVQETMDHKLTRLLENVCDWAQARVKVVDQALEELATNAGKCMDQEEFENYSSPNNDETLKQMFQELQNEWTMAESANTELASVFSNPVPVGTGGYCAVEYAAGHVLSLGQIRERSYEGLLSSNPMDPLEYRWGEVAGESPAAHACPAYPQLGAVQ